MDTGMMIVPTPMSIVSLAYRLELGSSTPAHRIAEDGAVTDALSSVQWRATETAPGETISGNDLKWANADDKNVWGTPTGTWMCMG